MAEVRATYDQICAGNSIYPEFRGPQHVRLETGVVHDFDQNGVVIEGSAREEVFAVPREFNGPNEPSTGDNTFDRNIQSSPYTFYENGAAVSVHADLDEAREINVGPRSIVRPCVKVVGDLIVGAQCDVGPRSYLEDSTLGNKVVTGYDNLLIATAVRSGSVLGDRVKMVASLLGHSSRVANDVLIAEYTTIGSRARLGQRVKIGPKCEIGNRFTAHDGAGVAAGARFRDRVTVEAGVLADPGRIIRSGSRIIANPGRRVVYGKRIQPAA